MSDTCGVEASPSTFYIPVDVFWSVAVLAVLAFPSFGYTEPFLRGCLGIRQLLCWRFETLDFDDRTRPARSVQHLDGAVAVSVWMRRPGKAEFEEEVVYIEPVEGSTDRFAPFTLQTLRNALGKWGHVSLADRQRLYSDNGLLPLTEKKLQGIIAADGELRQLFTSGGHVQGVEQSIGGGGEGEEKENEEVSDDEQGDEEEAEEEEEGGAGAQSGGGATASGVGASEPSGGGHRRRADGASEADGAGPARLCRAERRQGERKVWPVQLPIWVWSHSRLNPQNGELLLQNLWLRWRRAEEETAAKKKLDKGDVPLAVKPSSSQHSLSTPRKNHNSRS